MSLQSSHIKVLVIDKKSGDGTAARHLFGPSSEELLRKEGLAFTRVTTTEAALDLLHNEPFGLLLFVSASDDPDSLGEFQRMQGKAPATPSLVIGDEPPQGLVQRFLEAGARAFLLAHKLTSETLQQKIREFSDQPTASIRPDELEVIQALARIGADAANEDELIERATDLIGSTLYPDNFGILLLNRKRGELRAHPSYHTKNPKITHRNVPLSEGICGSVALTGVPRRIPDVRLEPDYLEMDPETRSELSVPLLAGKRILGVLNAESTRVDSFTDADERLMSTLAGQLATALLKARSFAAEHVQRRRAEMLERLALALSSTLDLSDLLRLICQESQTLFEADAAYVWLVQEEALVGFAGTGTGADAFIGRRVDRAATSALGARTIQERRALYVNEAATSPFINRELDALGEVKAVLGVPLIKGDQAIGALMILNLHEARAFSPRDMDTAVVLGSHAAIAIDNARLFEDERRRRHEAETLRKATAEIQASLDLSEVLDHILLHLARVVPFDSACIFLVEGEQLQAAACRNHPTPEQVIGRKFSLAEDEIAQEIRSSRRPMIIPDAQSDPRFKGWGDADFVRGWMGVPLIARGKVLGILTLDRREAGAYGETEAAIAQSLANQSAMAIENARLFAESQHQALALVGLYETALTVSSVLVTDALIARVREQVLRLLAPDSLGLFLYDESTDSFEISLAIEGGEPVPGIVGKTIPVGEGGLTGWVIQSRTPLLIKDILSESLPVKPFHFSDPARSWLGVPLIARDRMIGALTLQSFRPNAFTNSDRRYLESIGAQVAIALENANLYERARRGVARQEALNNIVAAGASAMDLNTLLEIALDNMLRATGLKAGWIRVEDTLIAREMPETFIQRLFQQAASLGPEAAEILDNFRTGDPQSASQGRQLPLLTKLLSGIGLQAILSAPILHGETRIGGVALVSRERYRWSQEEVVLVEAVARELTAALERMRLFALARSHTEHMERLVPLSEALNKSFTVTEVLAEIGRGAAVLSESAQIAIFLRGPDNAVTCPWSIGLSGDYIQLVCARARELPGGQLLHTHDPVLIEKIVDLPAHSPLRTLAEEEGFAAYGLWPMIYEEAVTAAVGCYYPSPRTWTKVEQDAMLTFVRQAAVALKNAELFERATSHADKLSTLYEIGKEITTTLDMGALLQLISRRAVQLTGADKCLIILTDTVAGKVVRVVGQGFAPAQLEDVTYQEVQDGISGWVLRHRKPTLSTDLELDPRNTATALERLKQEPTPGKSIAVAPLMVKEEIIGTLTLVNNADKPALKQDDLDLIVMLASQAAIALDNVNLFEIQRKRSAELDALRRASLQLTGSLELRPVLEAILEQAQKFMAADHARIFLYEGGKLSFGAARTSEGLIERPDHQINENGLSYTVAREGKQIVVPDASSHIFYKDRPWHGAKVGLPLAIGAQVRGVMSLTFDQPRPFSSNELHVLEMFADQAAIALDNARSYNLAQKAVTAHRRRAQELETLSRISGALRGAENAQQISQTVVEEAALLTQADMAGLYLFADNRQYLFAFGNAGRQVLPSLLASEALGGSPTQSLAVQQSTETLAFNWDLLEDIHSGICLPLKTTGGQMMGVLLVAWEGDHGTTRSTASLEAGRLLGTLTEIAANALQRARSHEELEGAYLQTVLALAKAMDARDTYTGDHSKRLARLAEAMAQELECSESELLAIRWAALLHDIGKIGVPDEILNKPGPLTEEEWLVMKRHPEIGAEIVAPVEKLADVVPIIRAHQEKFDGTGYPDQLAGEKIPKGARILMVADAYSAMTDDRVYRKARTHLEALSEVKRCSGTQFDPEIVKIFLQIIDKGQHPG